MVIQGEKQQGYIYGIALNERVSGNIDVSGCQLWPSCESFIRMYSKDFNKTSIVADDGTTLALACNERYYVPSEITWQLKTIGFKTINIYGTKLGAFSREDKLTTNDFEMLVIAEK
jgi:hypothetical protein